MKEFEMIVTIVNRGFSESVMTAARAAGARGGTILTGRGTVKEAEVFFKMSLQSEKEVVLIVTEKEKKNDIMIAIVRSAGLMSEGQGITFSLPVEDTVGMVF